MASVSDINDARSALSYALRYIRVGWWVLPLTPGTKKPLGKLVRNGFHDATNDVETATSWWQQTPEAGVGIALRKSGLVAIDIDPRNGGIGTIENLEAAHGAIASDVLALTGGGGEHRVFAAELVEGLPGSLGPGVDLKADGYIAVEPTFAPLAEPAHRKPYAWEASSDPLDGVVPTTLPSWIRDLSRKGYEAPPGATAPPATAVDPRRLASTHEALPHVNADERETWLHVGMAIHQEMPTQAGFTLWDTWAQKSTKYDPQDQLRVWRSFKRRPLGEKRVDLNAIFAMAQRAGWKNTGGPLGAEEPRDNMTRLLSLQELDEASKMVSWSIKHILPADSVGVMFGAPGTFKSFIALDMALHIAHGLKWLGKKTMQGAVIYIAAEGGTGLMRRIRAWHKARSLQWSNIPFFVLPAAVMLSTRSMDVVQAAAAIGVVPALVVVDTKSQTDEGEENSSTDTARYFREIGRCFRATWGCSVMVIHHSGHSATERPRGSSAILGNVDFLFGVFRDEKELMATVQCERQKDGELFEPVNFELSSHLLGKDEDGEEIRSLVARHLNTADELLEAVAKGQRGGHNALLMQLAQSGMPEKELRALFVTALDGKEPEARRQAWYRALKWAVGNRLIEVAQGTVIVLKKE